MQKQRKRRGDRRDARRVREIDAFHSYIAYLMPQRCDAEVYLNGEVDVTELLRYLREKNEAGAECRVTLFHAMTAAISRVIMMRPLLNRYIAGRRYYQRHDISLSFVAKKRFDDYAEEALMILRPKETDTLADFSRVITGEVHRAREEEENYGADSALKILQRLPRPMMSLFMLLLRIGDFYDRVPRSLTELDPNYTTVLISNLGSIRCDAVYHHLNNFGTNSILMTIGELYRKKVIGEDGNEMVRDMVEIGMTVDERIAEGFYFARCIKLLKYIAVHPQLLDRPLKEAFDYDD